MRYIKELYREQSTMKSIIHILAVILLLRISFDVYADDIRIPAKGDESYSVSIVDRGTNGARYDATTESIIKTSDGTKIRIKDIDFGEGNYGTYNQFFFEYNCPDDIQDAYFDVFVEDTTTPFLSIPISRTNEDEYVGVSQVMDFGLLGNHDIFIKWRNHSASLKTIGLNALKPVAKVDLIRTGSLSTYKISSSAISMNGVQNLKMIWKGNNANVKNVIFGNTESAIHGTTSNGDIRIIKNDNNIILENPAGLLKWVEIYSINSICVFKSYVDSHRLEVNLNPGIYIVKTDSGVFKILI